MNIAYIDQLLQEFESENVELRVLQESDKSWSGEIVNKLEQFVGHTTNVGESLADLFEVINSQCEEYLDEYDDV